METPPIQCTMGKHCEAHSKSRNARVLMIAIFFVFVFVAGYEIFLYKTRLADASNIHEKPSRIHLTAVAINANREPFQNMRITARGAVVLDASTGLVLYEKNPDVSMPMASLTKVAMVLAISEVVPSGSRIILPKPIAATKKGSQINGGTTWSVQDLIDYTLVSSSNEGAKMLAEASDALVRVAYANSPDASTVWLMNKKAVDLGLRNTHFSNPSGLDISASEAGAYGSPRDVAKLFAYAASTSANIFAKTTEQSVEIVSSDNNSAVAYNTDTAIPHIQHMIMGKTGYTLLAGGNLAIVFEPFPGRQIVAVVMGSSIDGRFTDMLKLINATKKAIELAPEKSLVSDKSYI